MYIYPVIFYKEENVFSIVFPNFGGGSQGDDLDDAMENAQEFLDSIVAYYIDENIELPKPIDLATYEHESEFKDCDFINTLVRANPLRFVQNSKI